MGAVEMNKVNVKDMQIIDDAISIIEQSKVAIKLCKDLLDPESLGLSTTKEIRNRAREVLGIEGRE